MTVPRKCFGHDCTADAIPSSKFCARHLREAERWLVDERRLDATEEQRRKAFDSHGRAGVMNGWDDRPSALDEIRDLGWDDPDQIVDFDELAIVEEDDVE